MGFKLIRDTFIFTSRLNLEDIKGLTAIKLNINLLLTRVFQNLALKPQVRLTKIPS